MVLLGDDDESLALTFSCSSSLSSYGTLLSAELPIINLSVFSVLISGSQAHNPGGKKSHPETPKLDFRCQFTLPFEPYRRTCTRFYGRSRALKTGQFFFEPTPHHDGPPFDPMPTSDADPQTSATASHPGDVTRVAARSDSADGGSAVTIFGIVAICYKWGDAKSPR